MAKRKAKAKAESGTTRKREDRSFGTILRTKSTDRIVPEAVIRLEAGRRDYAKEALSATQAEFELLTAERERLKKAGVTEGRQLARLDRMIAAVEVELGAHRRVLDEIGRALAPIPGGWFVFGRVLCRDGSTPGNARVVFLDDNDNPVKKLGELKPDRSGIASKAYSAELTKDLEEKRTRILAAVCVNQRIVSRDTIPTFVRADGIHQFDLRVDTAFGERKRTREQGDKR